MLNSTPSQPPVFQQLVSSTPRYRSSRTSTALRVIYYRIDLYLVAHVPCDADQCCSAEPRTLKSVLVTPCGRAACRQIHDFRLAGCNAAKTKDHYPETGLAVNFQKIHIVDVSGRSRPQQMENGDAFLFPPLALVVLQLTGVRRH